MYAKFENPSVQTQELQQTNALYIEAMKSGLANMTPEEAQRVMQAFKTDGIKYLDVLDSKTTNPQNKAMINNMRQTIYKSSNPMSVVSRLENYAPIPIMQHGIGAITRGINKSKIQYAAEKLTAQGYTTAQAYSLAKQQAMAGELAMPASTAVGVTAIAAIAIGLYSIYKASNMHKEFIDLYFGE